MKFGQNSEFQPNFQNSGQTSEFLPNFRISTKFQIVHLESLLPGVSLAYDGSEGGHKDGEGFAQICVIFFGAEVQHVVPSDFLWPRLAQGSATMISLGLHTLEQQPTEVIFETRESREVLQRRKRPGLQNGLPENRFIQQVRRAVRFDFAGTVNSPDFMCYLCNYTIRC